MHLRSSQGDLYIPASQRVSAVEVYIYSHVAQTNIPAKLVANFYPILSHPDRKGL
jgi:hypothetical protein